jgi:hypothetical protein
MAVATGQFTIIDYNDALSLSAYIASNRQKTQIFNPDNGSYNPDWASSNVILTPSLFILGNANDIITSSAVQSIQWYDVSNGVETLISANASYAIGAAKPNALTIKSNVLAGLPGKEFMCKIVYRDPSTGLDLIVKTPISFSRVVSGSGITDAIAWAPNGNVFKNDETTSLIAECDLVRGSVVDSTNVTYQWYQFDTAQTTDAGGGNNWRKLTNVANVTTGVTTRQMTVFPAAVPTYAVFKCVIKDTDASSNTYNSSFEDNVTFEDKSDPVQVTITSTGGDVFKNGVGSTTLTAKVFQAGAEVDAAGTKYTYKWFKLNSSGVLDSNFGGTGINFKTGKTLSVGDADVDVKATFQVEVS